MGPLLPDIDEDLGVSHAVAGLLGTIPVLCMGLAGALIPVVVKERFAKRPAFASGVYTTGLHCTILLFAGWLLLTPSAPKRRLRVPWRLPWRRCIVWGFVALFALQSVVYYGLVAWMPDAFQERGWSDHSAARWWAR